MELPFTTYHALHSVARQKLSLSTSTGFFSSLPTLKLSTNAYRFKPRSVVPLCPTVHSGRQSWTNHQVARAAGAPISTTMIEYLDTTTYLEGREARDTTPRSSTCMVDWTAYIIYQHASDRFSRNDEVLERRHKFGSKVPLKTRRYIHPLNHCMKFYEGQEEHSLSSYVSGRQTFINGWQYNVSPLFARE